MSAQERGGLKPNQSTINEPPPGFIPLPRSFKQKIKDIIVAFALANACFIRVWLHLLYDGNRFFDKQPVVPAELAALAVNILGLGLLIWFGIGLWRRQSSAVLSFLMEAAFLFLLLFPTDYVRTAMLGQTDAQTVAMLKKPISIAVIVVLFLLFLWKHRRVAQTMAFLIALTFPVALLTLLRIFLVSTNIVSTQVCPPALPSPPVLPVRAGQPRIVWIIFDETDYRMAFAQRPSNVLLPEFDRLRAQSISAEQAYAPADRTIVSMPALISGRRLIDTRADGCDLALVESKTTNDWTTLPSVFSEARGLGFNTALVGWYIPYPRLLGASLNYCNWEPMAVSQPVDSDDFFDSLREQDLSLAWPFRNRQIFINLCRRTLDDSLSVAGDPSYGLLLFHLPPPHFPGVYLPEKKEFTWRGVPRPGAYLKNLGLADLELGELRAKMESSGQWDQSWVIMSADHSWRTSQVYDGIRDYRVPYLIKPPNSKTPSTYSKKFNTVITHDLILAILRGQITSQSSAAAWMDVHVKPDMPVLPSNVSSE